MKFANNLAQLLAVEWEIDLAMYLNGSAAERPHVRKSLSCTLQVLLGEGAENRGQLKQPHMVHRALDWSVTEDARAFGPALALVHSLAEPGGEV
eukprot:3267585-Pleurochrysis_carterae.AAC.1